jgi:lysyl-tRNA synthetase class 2
MERVYYLGKNFRNEGVDTTHNPEFTMMECYQICADYNDMMRLTENMMAHVAKKVLGTTKVNYQGTEIDLTPPWKRISMEDAVKEYAKIDLTNYTQYALEELAESEELELAGSINKATVINALFEKYVEEHLIQPTFVIDYPVEISPLTKKHRSKAGLTERFELYINGIEFANAYSELNDPLDQKSRFEQQVKEREKGDQEAHRMDEDFVNALMYGMPPTGGLGVGIDRLVMLLTNNNSIKEVILFPMMRD